MLTKKSQACSAHREVFFGSAEQSDSQDNKPQVWHHLFTQRANRVAPSTPLQEELQYQSRTDSSEMWEHPDLKARNNSTACLLGSLWGACPVIKVSPLKEVSSMMCHRIFIVHYHFFLSRCNLPVRGHFPHK